MVSKRIESEGDSTYSSRLRGAKAGSLVNGGERTPGGGLLMEKARGWFLVSCRFGEGYSAEENLDARGEASGGRGFLRSGDDVWLFVEGGLKEWTNVLTEDC